MRIVLSVVLVLVLCSFTILPPTTPADAKVVREMPAPGQEAPESTPSQGGAPFSFQDYLFIKMLGTMHILKNGGDPKNIFTPNEIEVLKSTMPPEVLARADQEIANLEKTILEQAKVTFAKVKAVEKQYHALSPDEQSEFKQELAPEDMEMLKMFSDIFNGDPASSPPTK